MEVLKRCWSSEHVLDNEIHFVEFEIYRTVQEIMCKLNDHELGDLRTRHFWRKAEHLRIQAKVS